MPWVVIRYEAQRLVAGKAEPDAWVSTASARSATWRVTPYRDHATSFEDATAVAWILANDGTGVRFWTEPCES